MALALTSKQRDEINKYLLSYFAGTGFSEVAEVFSKEVGVERDPACDNQLERKWRSIVRIQQREKQLIEKREQLKKELDEISRPDWVDESDTVPKGPAKHVFEAHQEAVTCVRFHPFLPILATASEDCTVMIWDFNSGRFMKTLKGHTEPVQFLAFNPAGTILATSSNDTTIRLWECEEWNCTKTLTGHERTVSSVEFTENGDFIWSASRDKTIKLWEVATGFCKRTLEGHDDWVRQVTLSPDQRLLASCSMDQTIHIWEAASGKPLTQLRDHDHVIETIAWSNARADKNIIDSVLEEEDKKVALVKKSEVKEGDDIGGMFLVSGCRDRTIRIWFIPLGVCVKVMYGHDSWVRTVLFHPSGRYIMSCSDDKTVRLWDLTKHARCTMRIDQAHETFVNCIDWNKRLSLLASGGVDKAAKVWEAAARR